MVEPIEVVIGLFLVGLVWAEFTGRTDVLGRRRRRRLRERYERPREGPDEGETDDGPRF